MSDVSVAEPRNGEIVEHQGKALTLGEQLKSKQQQFVASLPAHIPVERFMRVIATAVTMNPALWRADRQSLWNACMKAATDGLLPDGREGALVIFRTKKFVDGREQWIDAVQWMPMVAGLRKKVRQSGEISTWEVQVVHARDAFEFELGDEPYIKHKPCLEGDPGPVIAAYSVATLKTGERSREVMTRSQIEKVRSVSKAKNSGPWVDWYEEMCRKVVARRHSKVLPMNTDLDDMMRRDDDLYDLPKADALPQGERPQGLRDKLDALSGIGEDEDLDPAPPTQHEHEHEPEPAQAQAESPPAPASEPTPEPEPKKPAKGPKGSATPEQIREGWDAADRGTIPLQAFLTRFKGQASNVFGQEQIGQWRERAVAQDKAFADAEAGPQ